MSRDDYRPAAYQITNHYRCDRCGHELEIESTYSAGKCACGGHYQYNGESYPGNSDDWDEQRDPDGEWRQRRY